MAAQLVDGNPQTVVTLRGVAKDQHPTVRDAVPASCENSRSFHRVYRSARLRGIRVEAADAHGHFVPVEISWGSPKTQMEKCSGPCQILNETTTEHLRIVISAARVSIRRRSRRSTSLGKIICPDGFPNQGPILATGKMPSAMTALKRKPHKKISEHSGQHKDATPLQGIAPDQWLT